MHDGDCRRRSKSCGTRASEVVVAGGIEASSVEWTKVEGGT